MDHLLILLAFALGAVAGNSITRKDPAAALWNSARRRGPGFIVLTLAIGFAAEILWEVISRTGILG